MSGSIPKEAAPGGYLSDPVLQLLADVVDDLESIRKANANRLNALTRSGEDKDGEERGLGLDESVPAVATLAAIVEGMEKIENQAVRQLEKQMKAHPLGPYVMATPGVGLKGAARLLAAVGDPYWNDLHDRPRSVSELWAYCGYAVKRLPAGQNTGDAQPRVADGNRHRADHARDDDQPPFVGAGNHRTGQIQHDAHTSAAGPDQASHPGQCASDIHVRPAGVAVRRQKGQKVNWSTAAKTRAFLIAEAAMKNGLAKDEDGNATCVVDKEAGYATHADGCRCTPYRKFYDRRRSITVDRIHPAPCVRCGPKGTPAAVGTPWSKGHRHADALRLLAKEILEDLWHEAKRLYEVTP